jgi:hypothetical protein
MFHQEIDLVSSLLSLLFFWLRLALNIQGCFISRVRLYSVCVIISGLWSHLGSGGLEHGGSGGDLVVMEWMVSFIGDKVGFWVG